jgi:hypothetical protein
MKVYISALVVLMTLESSCQTSEFGVNYVFSLPQGYMKENMTQAHGAIFNYYYTPSGARYSIGLDFSANIYGHDRTEQTYTFEDGITAPMDIVVNNNFYNIMLTGRQFLGRKKIQPYVNAKLGVSIYATQLNIYDPDDTDQCEPVDSDVLKRDAALIFSAGGGIRWEMLPKKQPGRYFFDLSANYSSGGRINYMNVDAPANSHSNHTSDVYAKFINTQTQVVHDHHIGNVYTGVIEQIDIRFGVTMILGTIGK